MKKIELFERAIAEQAGSLKDWGINQTLFWAYRSSMEAGNERINFEDVIVALKYGYDSPESFTRAFVRFHGITPSEAKKDGKRLKALSRVSVQIIMRGGSVMNYKIVTKEAFPVLERTEQHSIDDEQNKNTVPDFWTRSHADGTVKRLLAQAPEQEYIFGICYGNAPKEVKTFDYSIAAPYGGGRIPDGFRVTEIPARTWAVFECRGPLPGSIQETWHKICTEFFPTAGYQPTYEMDIEAYPNPDRMSAGDYCCEIWVAVEKKA